MIARALNALGLVSEKENDELRDLFTLVARERNDALISAADWEAKFKLAAADLAKQAEEIAKLEAELIHADDSNRRYASEIDALRPDALLWRAARQKRHKGKAP